MSDLKLITQEVELKSLTLDDDIVLTLKDEYDVDINSSQLIRKGLIASDLKFDEDERAVISTITTAAKDRDNEIVLPEGAILDQYEKNPVVLFGHDHWSLPIGKNQWIKQDKKGSLIAKTIYSNTEKAEEIFQYRKAGFPLAQSIGFIPLSFKIPEEGTKEHKAGVRRIYDKWILLEYSDVPVPSNPEAVAIAISKHIISEEDTLNINVNDEALVTELDKIKTEEPEFTTIKRADIYANPSAWDIRDALQSLLNPTREWLKWIIDIYPIEYPNGHVIFAEEVVGGKDKFYQQSYTYSEGKASLLDDKIEIESSYKPKKDYKASVMNVMLRADTSMFQEKLDELKNNILEEVKAGRVISAKNRKAITEAITAMNTANKAMSNASTSLKTLLDSADNSSETTTDEAEDNSDKEENKKDFVKFDFDIAEEHSEKADIDLKDLDAQISQKVKDSVKTILPIAIKEAVKVGMKTAQGKI